MDQEEARILEALDRAVRDESIRSRIDEIVARVEQKLRENPDDVLAWEPIPLDFYSAPLPEIIRSSWVFILRANTTTGPERHPNSHQRMMSYRGRGDMQTRIEGDERSQILQTRTGGNRRSHILQTRTEGDWCSHLLQSDQTLPIEQRWISIPPNVWHQAVVPGENWVVVSFHTAAGDELIEERPVTEGKEAVRQRKYAGESWPLAFNNPRKAASEIDAEIRALAVRNTPNERAIRRKYSRILKQASSEFIIDVARTLLKDSGFRWLAYELIANHQAAFQHIGERELEELGQGIDSWGAVDSFARTLAGPVWLMGQVSDELIGRWAQSEDRWWRRAALVSTVALNVRSHGGRGDVGRTLEVCRLLVDDHDDMMVKAMSWALRELVVHDADALNNFLNEYEEVLAARVKREVRNKLSSGLKNPRRKRA